jgi:type VI secretion system protein VasJ
MDPSSLRELGEAPIRPDAPAGDPARDDPDFEALEGEVRKLENPGDDQPDWGRVEKLATEILRTRSKDVLAACHLGVAVFIRAGWPGLVAGLSCLDGLVRTHWEGMYPVLARMRGRANAITWFGERASVHAQRHPPSGPAIADLDRARELAESLAAFLREKDDDCGLALGELTATLREVKDLVGDVPSAATAPAPTPSTPGGPAPASPTGPPPAPIAGGPLDSPAAATLLLGEIRTAAGRLAEYWRGQDPTDPAPYRLARSLAWAHLRETPPASGSRTQIPPPPEGTGRQLAAMVEAGQWPGVLQQTEDRLRTAVLWLDLQRYTWAALRGLGAEAAASAVARETEGLLVRLPGLPTLEFSDGTPLADAETRSWIAASVRTSSGGDGDDPAPVRGDEGEPDEAFATACAEARSLARKKQLPEALRLLEAGAATAPHHRVRARWQLEIGRICLETGHARSAFAYLDGLDRSLIATGVHDWDPAFSAELTKSLLQSLDKALSSQGNKPASAEEITRSRELRARLARLDIAAAVHLDGQG